MFDAWTVPSATVDGQYDVWAQASGTSVPAGGSTVVTVDGVDHAVALDVADAVGTLVVTVASSTPAVSLTVKDSGGGTVSTAGPVTCVLWTGNWLDE